jgi:LPXTG-site transpeptidase (sortase) family protein
MSQSEIARFHSRRLPSRENNPEAAHQARKRIAELPDPYLANATPRKEDLIGEFEPVSPAAENSRLHISSAPNLPHVTRPDIRPPQVRPADSPIESPKPPATPKSPIENPAPQPEPELREAGAFAVNTPPSESRRQRLRSAGSSVKNRIPSRIRPIIIAALTFTMLFVLFKAPIFLNQLGYLTSKPDTASTTVDTAQIGPDPVISIPKINVNAPIVFAQSNVEASVQKDLEGGVVHYAHTAAPGDPGNSVIFGHSSNDWWEPGNYKFVFVLLDKLAVGDTFTVNYNSKQYMYKVVESKVVEPTDLTVLNQTADPEMTLITCTPPGTSWKRLIVRAQQVSPAPQTASGSSSSTDTGITDTLPGNTPSWTDQISKFWHNLVEGLKS